MDYITKRVNRIKDFILKEAGNSPTVTYSGLFKTDAVKVANLLRQEGRRVLVTTWGLYADVIVVIYPPRSGGQLKV
jgi:hypothetical protein